MAFKTANEGAVGTVISFCWFPVLLCLYSVVVSSPPETATFRALDTLEIGAMSRYVILASKARTDYTANLK